MLTVTDAAEVLFTDLMELEGFSEGVAIRLRYGDHGLARVGDSERIGDMAFRDKARTVLLPGEHVSRLLGDRFLIVDGEELILLADDEGT